MTGEIPAQMPSNAEMFPFDDVIMSSPDSEKNEDKVSCRQNQQSSTPFCAFCDQLTKLVVIK